MNIEEMMKTYLEKKARIKFRELDIECLKENLNNIKKNIESKEDVIEGLCIGARTVTDMPLQKNNIFYSSTEEAAITCNDEMQMLNKLDCEKIESEIKSIETELEPIKKEVQQVEIFMAGLTERERFIADKFYIQSWTWEEVITYYNSEMPISKALRSLKSIKQSLLKKIQRISC